MTRYYISTIGCQMNQADSEAIAQGLERRGHRAASALEEAELIVVNSCVVRQSAEDKVANLLYSLRPLKTSRPHLRIALVGCMVDSKVQELQRRFPHVDLFLRPEQWEELWELAGGQEDGEEASPPCPVAFVPIIEGCDRFCSYCIVPFRRGRERSRPLGEVLCEVEGLARRGVREVNLLGQNVDSYGHDLPEKPDLADLLASLHTIPDLWRIRFLTSHPKDMSAKLIDTVARLDKACPHFSLPVQSGDDVILQAMKRGYTAADYLWLVKLVRETIPEAALSTDVIVGFPGETEEQFQRTLGLLREVRFDTVHVAAYSPRPGTAAARLPDNLSREEKKARLQRVEALQRGIAAEVNARLLGQEVEVLVEGEKGGKEFGRTRSGKLAFFPDRARAGELARIRIEKTSPWALQGRVG